MSVVTKGLAGGRGRSCLRDRPLHWVARADAGNAAAVLLAHGAQPSPFPDFHHGLVAGLVWPGEVR